MKTRATTAEVSVVILNPYNGFDVDVPDDLFEEYMQALKHFDNMRAKLGTALMSQAEAFDRKMSRWNDRNGLSLVQGGKENP